MYLKIFISIRNMYKSAFYIKSALKMYIEIVSEWWGLPLAWPCSIMVFEGWDLGTGVAVLGCRACEIRGHKEV